MCNMSVWHFLSTYCEILDVQLQLMLQLGEQLRVKQFQLLTRRDTEQHLKSNVFVWRVMGVLGLCVGPEDNMAAQMTF